MYNHKEIGNYKDECSKEYFAGTFETRLYIKYNFCQKEFGDEDKDDKIVPSAKEPIYICMGNAMHDYK
eukprot:6933767-Ditylum_brightwellii.AAC.1